MKNNAGRGREHLSWKLKANRCLENWEVLGQMMFSWSGNLFVFVFLSRKSEFSKNSGKFVHVRYFFPELQCSVLYKGWQQKVAVGEGIGWIWECFFSLPLWMLGKNRITLFFRRVLLKAWVYFDYVVTISARIDSTDAGLHVFTFCCRSHWTSLCG